jgi:hypothetical protein
VTLAVLIAGLVLWAYSGLKNAISYREVAAKVERVEEVCIPAGATVKEATGCSQAPVASGGKRFSHRQAVYVHYTSPSDGQEHSGVVIPIGGQKAVEATGLRQGDAWTILASKSEPGDIKAE